MPSIFSSRVVNYLSFVLLCITFFARAQSAGQNTADEIAKYRQMIADGNPAEVRGINQVGLERRGFSAEDTRVLREAYRKLYRSNLNVKQACEQIGSELSGTDVIAILLAFVESSSRGIIR